MKKAFTILTILAACVILWAAVQTGTDNKDGIAYGSAAQRDTANIDWYDYEYIDLQNARASINLVFKVVSAAADTVILNTRGANSDPDEAGSWYTIRADTMIVASDSLVVINLPYGTGVTTTALPHYLQVQVITADTTDGPDCTATIKDSYIWR